jgi:hypothetical protein
MTPLSTKEVPVEPTDEITFKYQVNGRGYQISSEFDVTREQCAAICKAIEGIITDEAAAPTASEKAEPVAWIRFCSDGTYEGPIHDKSREMSEFRKQSGAWTPLFTLSPSAEQALRMAADKVIEKYGAHIGLSVAQVILSLTNKQDTSAEQGEEQWQPIFYGYNQEKCGCQFALYKLQVTDCGGEWDPNNPPKLYTSPPSADAMFNAGIEAAAEACKKRHGPVFEILSLKRPTDTMVMSREEVQQCIDTANKILRSGGDYGDDLTDVGLRNELAKVRDLFVSRVKEGE